jgi:hypothetical protein
MNNSEKPHVGQLVETCWPCSIPPTDPQWKPIGVVTSVDGNICNYSTGTSFDSFIWRFKDGPNVLHRWGENPPVQKMEVAP